MSACTDFCENLKAIDLKHGNLPSHDELIAQLHFSDNDQERGQFLGTVYDLQQRTKCGFCQLVAAAVSESAGSGGNGAIRPEQPVSILIFPGEQSFRLSYPSRLGLRLAFVAEDDRHIRGPDTARLVHEPGIQISQIKSWLRACDDKHEACSLETIDVGPNRDEKYPSRNFNESATSNFRLIDLELGCVRHAALDTKYVTLSYVWGNLPMFKLKSDNFKQLSAIGSLDAIRTDLPNTVNNAIDLAKAMNERYLWVDGLCLVQDDEDDVRLGVEMMNSIYHGSYFTIVAGSGVDASAGLPGIGRNARDEGQVQVIKEIVPGMKMTILHSIDWHLSRSVYNRRGWTLQELILPRRTVIFVNGQVYFRCQEANWSEESWADTWTHWLDPDDSNISRIPDLDDGFTPSLWAYQKICEEYSRRKLRSDGDVLRALAGVSRPLGSGMKTMMIEGLPGYYLDHFLLFTSSNGDLRRRSEFASFSWAGWEGQIMWPRENFVWYDDDSERSWKPTNILTYFKLNRIVEWNALDLTAHLERLTSQSWDKPSLLLELMREHPDVFPDVDEDPAKQHKGSRWYSSTGSHCDVPHWGRILGSFRGEDDDGSIEERMERSRRGFPIKAFDLVNGQAEFDRLARRIENVSEKSTLMNWMAGRRFLVQRALERRSAVGPHPTSRDSEEGHYQFRLPRIAAAQTLEHESVTKDRRRQCGQYWAKEQAAKGDGALLSTYSIPIFPPYTVLHFLTISMHLILGTYAGRDHPELSPFDRIPGIPLFSGTGQLVGSLHPDNLDALEAPGSSLECIVVSRCNTPTLASALLTSNGADTERPWKLFWILYIVWKDGIAERRGVGQILRSALETAIEPKPEIKLILLG